MREIEISYSAVETFRMTIEVPEDLTDIEVQGRVEQAVNSEGATSGFNSTSYAVEVDDWTEV